MTPELQDDSFARTDGERGSENHSDSARFGPLNFMVFAAMRERGLIIAGIAPRFGLLFLESVVFAVLCRPENSPANSHHPGAAAIPLWMLLSFAAAVAAFVRRFFQTRKPIEPGFVWSVAAVFIWLQFAPVGKASDAYVATAALILAASLIETSYVLAYHDELTGIRGRRAFNESSAFARPAICHRHRRYRPLQKI